jgi:ABC-type bacteriocin/lantibiotic exporter with double-glycine peptidase domain
VAGQRLGLRDAAQWMAEIIGPDYAYIRIGIVYTVAITLLSLATPISVQVLINSVARTTLPAPLWTLSLVLLFLLLVVAGLSALRLYVMAMFERRIFARVVAEITVRAVHAQNPYFSDANSGHLFNRYFDMPVLQKSIPSLVIGAFTIILQAIVGLAVTSFYHPFFLAFNMVLVTLVTLIWLLWRRGAVTGAVGLSHAKHNAAHWLESVGGSNGFYKSSRYVGFAMDRTERVTAAYIDAHKSYFHYSFSQAVAYFLLYALASAGLLALGGNLIIQGQLSIGQLVAAELILSGVFYGISQLGWYLDTFYDMAASSEELSLLFSIPQESNRASGEEPSDGSVRMREVVHGEAHLSFAMAGGEQVVAVVEPGLERVLAGLLKRHILPDRGQVLIGKGDLGTFDMYLLRSAVTVLNRPTIVEVTIREYLTLAVDEGDSKAMMMALDTVGLGRRVATLPEGFDTLLSSSGAPLTIAEVMQLKLANAILSRPKVLLMSELFDMMPVERLKAALARLRESDTTVLLSTRRPEAIALEAYMWLGNREQCRFASHGDLRQYVTEREHQDA